MDKRRARFYRILYRSLYAMGTVLLLTGMLLSVAASPADAGFRGIKITSTSRPGGDPDLPRSAQIQAPAAQGQRPNVEGNASRQQRQIAPRSDHLSAALVDGVSVRFTSGDTALCQLTPTTINATAEVTLPEGAQVILQTAFRVVNPPDLRTENRYETHAVKNGDRVTVSGQWPGVRPGDAVVEIHFGAILLSPAGNPISSGAGLDYFWYPYVCPPPTVAVPNTPTTTATVTRPAATFTATQTVTPTLPQDPTATATYTTTPTQPPTVTATHTGTPPTVQVTAPSSTFTVSPTATFTVTPTQTQPVTATATHTSTATQPGSVTSTFTPTNTQPPPTVQVTVSSATLTASPTYTVTPTQPQGATNTATQTTTSTSTATQTATVTPTLTASLPPPTVQVTPATATPTWTASPTRAATTAPSSTSRPTSTFVVFTVTSTPPPTLTNTVVVGGGAPSATPTVTPPPTLTVGASSTSAGVPVTGGDPGTSTPVSTVGPPQTLSATEQVIPVTGAGVTRPMAIPLNSLLFWQRLSTYLGLLVIGLAVFLHGLERRL